MYKVGPRHTLGQIYPALALIVLLQQNPRKLLNILQNQAQR